MLTAKRIGILKSAKICFTSRNKALKRLLLYYTLTWPAMKDMKNYKINQSKMVHYSVGIIRQCKVCTYTQPFYIGYGQLTNDYDKRIWADGRRKRWSSSLNLLLVKLNLNLKLELCIPALPFLHHQTTCSHFNFPFAEGGCTFGFGDIQSTII
jgi:hypothetical protein